MKLDEKAFARGVDEVLTLRPLRYAIWLWWKRLWSEKRDTCCGGFCGGVRCPREPRRPLTPQRLRQAFWAAVSEGGYRLAKLGRWLWVVGKWRGRR